MISMARTYRNRIDWAWLQIMFGPMPEWRVHRDCAPNHCMCHAGARKHRRLTRKVTRQVVRRLLRKGDYVTASFLRIPAAYY